MTALRHICLLFLTFYQDIISAFSLSSMNRSVNFRIPKSVLNAESIEGWKVQGEIQPINNFILVKVEEIKDQTDGGIILTEKLKVMKTQGTVVAMGPGKYHPTSGMLRPHSVVAGDVVIYGKYDGTEICIDGTQHNLIRDENILVKINKLHDGKISLDNAQVVLDKVLIEVDNQNNYKSSNIIMDRISTNKLSRPSTGIVRKVGPGCIAENGEFIPMPVQKGDMVKFRDYAGDNVKFGMKEYIVVEISCILAKF